VEARKNDRQSRIIFWTRQQVDFVVPEQNIASIVEQFGRELLVTAKGNFFRSPILESS
jgi:hypothetical protein